MTTNMATVTSKGQVTIPKTIRRILNIHKSDRLLFVVEGDRLLLIPVRHRPLSELYSALPATRPFPGHQAVREEVRTKLGERMAQGEE
ncbi:MAG: AbrB/MazE/SpoVT family DNA-binding domain-containing protein [Anaerolineae bacterium]|nr:AbrB/MazE/SpoVT family DNA-binding domain-containing protein [Anaerolineae bacterium]